MENERPKRATSEGVPGTETDSERAKSPVSEAVRRLRNRLGDTQQQFATRMGWAISTVVRYELSRPPRGRALTAMEKLSRENGFEEEAEVFLKAFSEEFGYATPVIDKYLSFHMSAITDSELELVQDVLWAVRFDHEKSLTIEKELRKYRASRLDYIANLEQALVAVQKVLHLKNEGQTPEAIANSLSLSAADVRMWIQLWDEFGCRVPNLGSQEDGVRKFVFQMVQSLSNDSVAEFFNFNASGVREILMELGIPIPNEVCAPSAPSRAQATSHHEGGRKPPKPRKGRN